MSDFLWIIGYRSEAEQRNGFQIRGHGERYDALYRWLNGPKCSARSVRSDWPWDYITFDDPFHEQQFVSLYEDITFEKEYVPLPPNLKPKGWIPHEERVPGQSYLESCGHYHKWNPKPEGWSLEQELINELSEQIAKELDREILEELLKTVR